MHLLVCLFLDGILYNKVIVGSVAREWALYIVLLSSEPEGGIGTPECVASYSVGDRMSLELASELKAVLLKTCPLSVGSVLTAAVRIITR